MKLKRLIAILLSFFSFTTTANAEPNPIEPNHSEYRLYFTITSIDTGPVELQEKLPIEGIIFDKLDNEDGAEYYLAELREPIDSKGRKIDYIIVGARMLGQHIEPNMKELPINIAYVLDNSLLNQQYMDFAKGEFAAIGFATDTSSGMYK